MELGILDYSLPLREHRLNDKAMWSLVFSKGRRFQSGGLFLRAYPLSGKDHEILIDPKQNLRIGFILRKKILRRAHERNFVKRTIREFIRLQKPNWNGPWYLAFELKEKTEDSTLLNRWILDCLNQANIIKTQII